MVPNLVPLIHYALNTQVIKSMSKLDRGCWFQLKDVRRGICALKSTSKVVITEHSYGSSTFSSKANTIGIHGH